MHPGFLSSPPPSSHAPAVPTSQHPWRRRFAVSLHLLLYAVGVSVIRVGLASVSSSALTIPALLAVAIPLCVALCPPSALHPLTYVCVCLSSQRNVPWPVGVGGAGSALLPSPFPALSLCDRGVWHNTTQVRVALDSPVNMTVCTVLVSFKLTHFVSCMPQVSV